MVQTNSDLNQVFIKYTRVIVREEIKKKNRELHPMNNSLLDLESTDVSQVEAAVGTLNLDLKRENSQSDIDVLSDIFNATNIPDPILSNSSILLPMTVSKGDIQGMIIIYFCWLDCIQSIDSIVPFSYSSFKLS